MTFKLNEWIEKVSQYFPNATKAIQVSGTMPAVSASGGLGDITIPLSVPSGYVAVGVIGFHTGTWRLIPHIIQLTSTGVRMRVVNNTSVASAATTVYANVLCVKSVMGGYCVRQLLQRFQPFPRLEVV